MKEAQEKILRANMNFMKGAAYSLATA